MRLQAHSRNLRWIDASATFFITKSRIQRDQFSIQEHARSLSPHSVSRWNTVAFTSALSLSCLIIWHGLFALREPWTLPKSMHDFMSYVGRRTGRFLSTHDTAWQDGYYDTHVKTAKQFEYVAYYIE
jgi:hypothetical protein